MAATRAHRSSLRRPQLNLVDVPELLPGACPGANPALREQFEEQCRKLHREEAQTELVAPDFGSSSSETVLATENLEAMFPMVEPALIQALVADASSLEQAVELLLALSASASDHTPSVFANSPARDLKVVDPNQFPVLVNSEGWQVTSIQQLQRIDEDLGSAWCDRAKDAADLPAPQPLKPKVKAAAQQHGSANQQAESVYSSVLELPRTEYELRQETGQRHRERRSRFGRRLALAEDQITSCSEVVSDSCDDSGSDISLEVYEVK